MILHACEIPACPWPCLSRVGRFLPLLALVVIFDVVQRCLFFAWCYLALLAALVRLVSFYVCLFVCSFVCLFCLALLGLACLACRFLPLLALLVIIGVAQP